jgi:hypothetical protein
MDAICTALPRTPKVVWGEAAVQAVGVTALPGSYNYWTENTYIIVVHGSVFEATRGNLIDAKFCHFPWSVAADPELGQVSMSPDASRGHMHLDWHSYRFLFPPNLRLNDKKLVLVSHSYAGIDIKEAARTCVNADVKSEMDRYLFYPNAEILVNSLEHAQQQETRDLQKAPRDTAFLQVLDAWIPYVWGRSCPSPRSPPPERTTAKAKPASRVIKGSSISERISRPIRSPASSPVSWRRSNYQAFVDGKR